MNISASRVFKFLLRMPLWALGLMILFSGWIGLFLAVWFLLPDSSSNGRLVGLPIGKINSEPFGVYKVIPEILSDKGSNVATLDYGFPDRIFVVLIKLVDTHKSNLVRTIKTQGSKFTTQDSSFYSSRICGNPDELNLEWTIHFNLVNEFYEFCSIHHRYNKNSREVVLENTHNQSRISIVDFVGTEYLIVIFSEY